MLETEEELQKRQYERMTDAADWESAIYVVSPYSYQYDGHKYL